MISLPMPCHLSVPCALSSIKASCKFNSVSTLTFQVITAMRIVTQSMDSKQRLPQSQACYRCSRSNHSAINCKFRNTALATSVIRKAILPRFVTSRSKRQQKIHPTVDGSRIVGLSTSLRKSKTNLTHW